jgi:hemoglobin-like flavoprotein
MSDRLQAPITPVTGMTLAQRRLVRDSFESLREQARPLTMLFYGKLFELDPSARLLFHNDIVLQGRKLIDMLALVIESLNDFAPMRARLVELGQKHTSYGVRLEQYDTLKTAFLWAIAQALGADFDAATKEAWTLAMDAICVAMKPGV